jgi:predicted RNA-binding protein YlxR (DUF448 family)/ribosomal protein L30E
LLRFVVSPDGVVTPDLAGKLPGRGAWTCAAREAVIAAASKGLFARAFKRPARLPEGMTPEDFAALVERGLETRALAALGLARRAGKAVLGFDQTQAALKEGKAAALITAADAAADGAAKLARLGSSLPIVRAFTALAQTQALGRENVTHAALLIGGETARFLREIERLAGFRPVWAADGPRAAKE